MKRKVKRIGLFFILVFATGISLIVFYFNSVPKVCKDSSLLISSISVESDTIKSNSEVSSWGEKVLVSTEKGVVVLTSDFKSEILSNTEQVKKISVINDMMYYEKNKSVFSMNLITNENIEIFNNKKYKLNGLTVVGDKIYGVNGGYNNYLACYDINTREVYKIDGCDFPMEGIGYYQSKYYYIGDGGLNTIYAYDFAENEEVIVYSFDGVILGFFMNRNMIYVCGERNSDEEDIEYAIVAIDLNTSEGTIVLESSERIFLRGFINNNIIYSDYDYLYLYDLVGGNTVIIRDNYNGDWIYVVNNYIVANPYKTNKYIFLNEYGEELYILD